MALVNLEEIDVSIEPSFSGCGAPRQSPGYRWPGKGIPVPDKVDQLFSDKRGYKWHNVPLEEVAALVGFVSRNPAAEGRCMIFEVTPAGGISGENVLADLSFLRYQYLIPSLAVMSGERLAIELERRLDCGRVSLYCTSNGFFWMRKGIYGIC